MLLSVACCIETWFYRDMLYFIYLSLYLSLGLFISYLCNLFFFIIIFIFITINKIILMQANLLFGCVCQKFSPRVLLSFCLHFCQFWSNVTCKSVAYKKRLFKDFFQFHSLIPNRIEVIFENF